MGELLTINTQGNSDGFRHNLRYTFCGSGGSIASDITTSYDWTVPLSLANQIPNVNNGTLIIYCKTFLGNIEVGEEKTVTVVLNVSSTVIPSISGVSITEGTGGLAAKFGAYIQNKSTLNVAITASGARGSTIVRYETYIQGKAYRSASFTSTMLTASGTINVVTTVTDSIGRTKQVTNSINVVAYSPPTINSMRAYRINGSGTAAEDGTKLAVYMNFAIDPVSVSGVNKNNRNYSIE